MLVFLIAACLILQFSHCEGHVVYKTLRMQCLPNPKFITNVTCKLKPINWFKSVSNMECDIVNTLRNISINVQTFAKNYANQYKPFVISAGGNLCDVIDKKRFPAVTTIIMAILQEVSNVNHSCPFNGHIIAKGLYLNEAYIPMMTLPLGTYRAIFDFFEGYPIQSIGTVIFDAEAMEKKIVPQSDQRKRKSGKNKTILNAIKENLK